VLLAGLQSFPGPDAGILAAATFHSLKTCAAHSSSMDVLSVRAAKANNRTSGLTCMYGIMHSQVA